jgi:hypothetical protein
MLWLASAWRLVRAHWKAALIAAAMLVLAVLRLRWTAAGKALEQAAQANRNDRARKEASDARDRALGTDDPRRELLRRFRRADST